MAHRGTDSVHIRQRFALRFADDCHVFDYVVADGEKFLTSGAYQRTHTR